MVKKKKISANTKHKISRKHGRWRSVRYMWMDRHDENKTIRNSANVSNNASEILQIHTNFCSNIWEEETM